MTEEKIMEEYKKDLEIYLKRVETIFALMLGRKAQKEEDKASADYYATIALKHLEDDNLNIPYRGNTNYLLDKYEELKGEILRKYKGKIDPSELNYVYDFDSTQVWAVTASGLEYNLLDIPDYAFGTYAWWSRLFLSKINPKLKKYMLEDIIIKHQRSALDFIDAMMKKESTKPAIEKLLVSEAKGGIDKEYIFTRMVDEKKIYELYKLQKSGYIDFSGVSVTTDYKDSYPNYYPTAIKYICDNYHRESLLSEVHPKGLFKLLFHGKDYIESTTNEEKQNDILRILSYYNNGELAFGEIDNLEIEVQKEALKYDFELTPEFITKLFKIVDEGIEYSKKNNPNYDKETYHKAIAEVLLDKITTDEQLEVLVNQNIQFDKPSEKKIGSK